MRININNMVIVIEILFKIVNLLSIEINLFFIIFFKVYIFFIK